MGKQLNYIMDFESFKKLSQYALELGCLILYKDHTENPSFPSADLSIVVPQYSSYYFYIPELYPLNKITHGINCYGRYYLNDAFFSPFSLSLIEASFSRTDKGQARIYVTTGYYDEEDNWIARPELLTKTYEKLARRARKLAQKII
ncbi:MAG: hypothetical protein J6C26_10365 [Clostridia bacterium]|nr:hypothetical protein [Clostridia bacterium]